MRYRIRVPALGEHRDRNDAADGASQLAVLSNGIHDLAEQCHVIEFFPRSKVISQLATTLHDFVSEAGNFVGGHVAEIVIEPLTGFELLAVDEQRVWPGERVAMLIKIAEQREAAGYRGL